MTDIGTGSYTIIAQTAAEMLGLPIEVIDVRLGDTQFPVSAGSGGSMGRGERDGWCICGLCRFSRRGRAPPGS